MADETITVEQYEEIKAGLLKVEKMLNDTTFAKMEEKITSLEDLIEKQNKTISDLSSTPGDDDDEGEGMDVEKMKEVVGDVMKEALEPFEKRLDEIENTPMMKGNKDEGDGDPIQKRKGENKEQDILGDIIRDAYNVRRH